MEGLNKNSNSVEAFRNKFFEGVQSFKNAYQDIGTLTQQLLFQKTTLPYEELLENSETKSSSNLQKLGDKIPDALASLPIVIIARTLLAASLLLAKEGIQFKKNLTANKADKETNDKLIKELTNKNISETTKESIASAEKKDQNSTKLKLTPQIIQKTNGEVIVIKPAEKTTFLALQGGGAKGMAYPTYLKALEENAPFIGDLKDVAGSSAGSMMALLLSSGVNLDEIDAYVNEADLFKQMQGGFTSLSMGKGLFSAGNLTLSLRDMSQASASSYCQDKDWDSMEQKLTEKGIDKETIAKFKAHMEKKFEKGVTFSDLDLLHRLEPSQFKRLHVTGYEKLTESTIYFNAQDYPDMFCHEAVRISMAIPTVVKPIILDGKKLSDGGQGSNLPSEALEKANQKSEGRTLALVFGNSGRTHLALSNPMKKDSDLMSEIQNKIAATINSLIGKEIVKIQEKQTLNSEVDSTRGGWHGSKPTLFRQVFLGDQYVENQKIDKQKLYDLGSEVGVVPHGKLDTLSFTASAKKIAQCKLEAKLAGTEFAMRRNGEASYETFKTMEKALASLTPEQRKVWEAEQTLAAPLT